MRTSLSWSAIAVAVLSLVEDVQSRAVFAHYMIGVVSEAHAHKDIDDAKAMGLDGFALNIGDPLASWLPDTLSNLYGYAEYVGFHLYISMDLYASGAACYAAGGVNGPCHGPSDFNWILDRYLGSSASWIGENGHPLVSTFSAGKWNIDDFTPWKTRWPMYFVPDFDATAGYYTNSPDWWKYWGKLVDGLFSWESTWPNLGATNDGDVSLDKTVLGGCISNGKSYMIGLSMLQYKNAYGTNIYRRGEETLTKRMANILAMNPAPLYVEVVSWNDGPEGHYIGNLWTEQNSDAQPMRYASQQGAPHNAIQPLITSFINAFKELKTSSSAMAPPSGTTAVGALWYKTILQSSVCPFRGLGETAATPVSYYDPPTGSGASSDSLNWAVVIQAGVTNMKALLYSEGRVIQTTNLVPGLNHGSVGGISAGTQVLVVQNTAGAIYKFTPPQRCISSGCPDGMYNYNPQIVGLTGTGSFSGLKCWQVSGTPVASGGAISGVSYGPA